MAHEDLKRDHEVAGSSDRSFGLVFAAVFAVIACWPLLYREPLRWWAVVVAALFAAFAVARPALLAGLNRRWMKVGILLGRVVSPVALGILFYAVFTPIGILMKLLGSDPLHLKRDGAAASYWRRREPPGPPPDSMTNQF